MDVVGVVTPLVLGVAQVLHGDQVSVCSSKCRRWKEKKKTDRSRRGER